ncbi:hypothetical protein [Flavilitoribacter nigricans]|uniref:Uncharacterized protein n=1 Tax=Flavilitoribacter nigricans (strain ATCC 23147 / DSM 23189 / NBRC 102662 / NCIMB 1420 / SS-2) TaxID=1122177 RepID=A0A2D0NDT5_FLAN2|nr:hypothetical protein [Flavilitoribacter nigricans]PHN06568.1 hypothetical protein CRP01_09695 [Flavilitoribacter nigricans DSM 23189 = NBRC 102662]
MKTNQEAVQKARELIKSNQYVKDSDWSEAQPSPESENDFLEDHDWTEYGGWYLGIHTDENKETKGRYGFPYGDFRRLHRSGLIAAKQRSAQQGYDDLEKAIDQLLTTLDNKIDR